MNERNKINNCKHERDHWRRVRETALAMTLTGGIISNLCMISTKYLQGIQTNKEEDIQRCFPEKIGRVCLTLMSVQCIGISVLKSSRVQSFCPNFRQLATGLVAKFLKTRQLATELVATSCNQSFKRPVQDC